MPKFLAKEHGWDHDGLAEDLADSLCSDNRMIWTDMQLGPSGSPRPDVFCLSKSYAKPSPTVYEVKVSVADLRGDLNSGKSFKYFDFAGRVYFCFPSGMANKQDVPTEFGVRTRGEKGWKTLRHAPVRESALSQDAWMKLLIDGVRRERITARGEQYALARSELASRQKLAEGYRKWLRDKDHLEWLQIEAQKRHKVAMANLDKARQRAKSDVASAYKELAEIFGKPIDSSFSLRKELDALRRQIVPELFEMSLRRSIGGVRQQLDHLEGLIASEDKNAPVKEAFE